MGKFFDASLEKLGAERIHDLGVGNAETFSTEDDFNKWKEDIWSKIFDHFGKNQTDEEKKKSLTRRASSLKTNVDPNALPWIVDSSGIQLQNEEVKADYSLNMKNYLKSKPLPVKSIRQLRQKCLDGGSTLEVIYDLRGSGLTYKTAANLAIYATNKASDVEKFA